MEQRMIMNELDSEGNTQNDLNKTNQSLKQNKSKTALTEVLEAMDVGRMTFWRFTFHHLTFHSLTFWHIIFHMFRLLTFNLPYISPSNV